MMTDEGQGEAVGGDGDGDARGRWRQAGRGALGWPGSRCRWVDGGSMSVVVPGTGYAATGFRATQAGDGLALTVTLI